MLSSANPVGGKRSRHQVKARNEWRDFAECEVMFNRGTAAIYPETTVFFLIVDQIKIAIWYDF